MIRFMVLTFGRPATWTFLISTPLIFLILVAVIDTSPKRDTFGPTPTPDNLISPQEALESGGHTVTVHAICAGTGAELDGGFFDVITLDGRPPEQYGGYLSGNMAQIVVGPDWIGRVGIWKIHTDFDQISDLIGEPYGWHPRTVEDSCPNDSQ